MHPTTELQIDNKGDGNQKPEKPYRLFGLCERLGFLAPKVPLPCIYRDGDDSVKVTEMA